MDESEAANRRARWAVAAVFFANGAVIGGWAAQIPFAKERLAVGHGALGVALLAMAAGGMVAMPLAGAAIARLGSAAVTRASTVAFCLSLPLPVLAPNLVLLTAALLLFGAANGVMDVGMNAHGVAVEGRLGRPIMSFCHGMFSVGGLTGAGLAALLIPSMPPVVHALVLTGIGLAIAAVALFHLLPAEVDISSGGPAFAIPGRASLALGGLCFLAMSGEGAVLDWSALHLQGGVGMSANLAAIGFAAFSATMAAGRFTGDWMRGHFGAFKLVGVSAFVAAAGLTLALITSSPVLAIAGFAVVGLGVANLVPVLYGAAGALPGQATGSSIAAVATMGYMGFLAGPPLIGFVAEASSLRWALGLVVVAFIIIGVAAALRPARRPAPAHAGMEPL